MIVRHRIENTCNATLLCRSPQNRKSLWRTCCATSLERVKNNNQVERSKFVGKRTREQVSSSIILKSMFFNAHPLLSRPAASGTAKHSTPDSTGGDDRKRPVRWGMAWSLERWKCCCENLQFARRKVLVQGGRNLPDGDAQARQYPRIHCCW